jgi:acyl carrier protein
MDHKTPIRQFLRDLLARKSDGQPFSDDSSLLISGRFDSVDAVDIVVMLEEKFNIDFAEIGFDQSMIDSVDSIDSLIRSAQAAKPSESSVEEQREQTGHVSKN